MNTAMLSTRIDRSMSQMQTGIQTSIQDQTYKIVASQDALKQTFKNSFNQVNDTLVIGFTEISDQLGEMSAGFCMAIARVEDAIYKTSKEICDRLDAIHDIVNNPLLTQSRELYRRALDNYRKGFFEEALEDIKSATEKNKTDYISWYLRGKIYLFGVGEFSNTIDLDRAIEALSNAVKYISPDINTNNEARKMAAEMWFYLGIAQLSKSNDLLFAKKPDESKNILIQAKQSFERSYSYSDEMLEARYNVARCKVSLGDVSSALQDLEIIILKDYKYCIKVVADPDFSSISQEFYQLMDRMKADFYPKVVESLDEADKWKEKLESKNKDYFNHIKDSILDRGKVKNRSLGLFFIRKGKDIIHITESMPYLDMMVLYLDLNYINHTLSTTDKKFYSNAGAWQREKAKAERDEKKKADEEAVREEIKSIVEELIKKYNEYLTPGYVFNRDIEKTLSYQRTYFTHGSGTPSKYAKLPEVLCQKKFYDVAYLGSLSEEAWWKAYQQNNKRRNKKILIGFIIGIAIIVLLIMKGC
jgi:tetratricopeptide (TPR) repeat protein